MTTRRSIRALAATALAVAAAACALSAAGPTATASASNYNHRSDYLRFPAPVNYTKCTRRYITLNGKYEWSLYYQHWAHPDAPEEVYRDPLHLRGRYRWLDCLHYHRSSPGTIPFYRHRSWIRNELTGGEIEYKQDLWVWGIPDLAGDGSYDWGSRLYHIRPRASGAS
jgi:hypothetical protein